MRFVRLAAASLMLSASVAGAARAQMPDKVVTTWFGVANNHYQIGDLSFLQDGAVSPYAGNRTPEAALDRTWAALAAGGATPPAFIFVGHDHFDHAVDALRWSDRFPDARVFAPASLCARFDEAGKGGRCTKFTPETTNGRFVLRLNDDVEIRPVRWLHSSHKGCEESGNPDTPTFGLLIKARTTKGDVFVFSNDSGTSVGLTKPIDDEGGHWTAPLESLAAAMRDAGAGRLDLWQGGSETRVLRQARLVVPLWSPKAFQPQHWADKGDMFAGIAYDYFPGDSFASYLADHHVAMAKQDNYFDALEIDASGTRRLPNPAVKASFGLPQAGPGPSTLVPHPRLAENPSGECAAD